MTSNPLAPIPSVQERVDHLVCCMAMDLLDRTNTDSSVLIWDELRRRLHERVADIIEELVK